jgi:hypothetical protein
VLQIVREEMNGLHKIKRRKAIWIGHTLRTKFLLKRVVEGDTEGEIEVMERGGRRRKQLFDDLNETRGYWNFQEEELDRCLRRIRFVRGYGPEDRLG